MQIWLLASLLLLQIPTPRIEGGVITGILRQADGKPAAGVRVAAMPADDANAGGIGTTLVALSQTNESGNYRLEDVPPGDYYVVAGRVDAPTFYPGTPDVAGGQVVTVTAGTTVDGIDFDVTVKSMQSMPRDRVFQFPMTPDQALSLLGLRADPTVTVQVSGRIVMAEESKGAKIPERLAFVLRITPGTFQIPSLVLPAPRAASRSIVRPAMPAADGTFSIALPLGDARISVSGLPEGYSVKSMISGGRDLLSQNVPIQQGMPEIVIVLEADTRPRFAVSGTVVDSGSERPLLGQHIELVSESGTIVRIIIDAQGRFEFTRVLPGNYTLRLDATRFNSLAQPVTVIDGGLSLELRAIPR